MKLELDVKLSRRRLLADAARVASALPVALTVGALAACGEADEEQAAVPPRPPAAPKAPDPEPVAPAPAAPKPGTGSPKPLAEAEGKRLVTEIPANATLVTSLKYVNESPEAERRCGNCQLYTEGQGGRGKCALFQQGLVTEAGWCQSWVAKVG